MTLRKATHGQIRRENRQMLLRAVYSGLANSRVDLANETGLTKPTVSDLIGELIDEGYLVETGFGQSTEGGGKRPRLLKFVPGARHVIGISLSSERALGVLSDLDGKVLVHHFRDLDGAQGALVLEMLAEVINGLLAQQSAPLLCIGVGVPGLVDSQSGRVLSAPYLGWEDVALAETLSHTYEVPVYIANSTELAAMAQYAFSEINGANSLVTVLVNENVGVGFVLDGAIYHSGGEIGRLRVLSGENDLKSHLGWQYVRQKASALEAKYVNCQLSGDKLTYLHIREAISEHDPLAVALQNDLASYLSQIFAWTFTLLRPDHLSLAGGMADLGEPFLNRVIEKTRDLVWPDEMSAVSFSLDNATNLVAAGAVAQTLQKELGLI